jgi:hypothetical protein
MIYFIIFLLLAILVMTGWIMITLNEIDRTNHKLIHETNLNQVLIAKKIEALQSDIDTLKLERL